MSYRGNDILVIARLKKNPIAILQPDTNLRWHTVLLPLIILLILASTYFYFRHKKIRQALKQIKKQLSSNEEILKHYHIELEKMRKSSTETTASIQKSAELEQQIYLLEIQNEELKQHLAVREQKKQKTETERTHLSVSDEGYNLFIKLKAEPSYVFIGEKEHEHLCRITDKLYRQFASSAILRNPTGCKVISLILLHSAAPLTDKCTSEVSTVSQLSARNSYWTTLTLLR
ncbi:MAG: hypothetical protein BHV68_21545 [Bacteroidales bacterium 43_8]|nr:MAG: hypothetical protein BHV68_21545 [Bacteroidales bacterium 43_8]